MTDEYKRGYAKGYARSGKIISDAYQKFQKELDAAISRAEKSESNQGLGKCLDCAHWEREPREPQSCLWGWCTPPDGQYANKSPIWFRANDGEKICTAESFGCVMFSKRQGEPS